MSVNQSRTEKSEPPQYRKTGRSGSSGLQRNFSGGSGKGGGGGTAPPPSSYSNNSSLSSNRSFKKSSNAQGGQSRVSIGSVSSDSTNAAAASAHAGQNGAHSQPILHGTSDAPAIAKSADMSTQKSTRGVPKAPAHNSSTVTSNTVAPSTPAKGAGGFCLQFGSISPGFMNGMQIPARTSSAPPNLDEQKREQARYDSLRAASTLQTPTIPKQQLPTKNAGSVDQSNAVESHLVSKARRDDQVSAGPPTTQTQKPSIHPISGVPMQVPFHQPQLPVQFGGPNPQLQSQGMVNTSLPMPMPMPLPMGNPSQVQQQVFVQGLQPHMMQAQGIMHQGQTMNFSSQMGTQLPPQLGNMGISITPQFPQQHPGKFGGPRKTVKITHPDTHEELRLDKRADTYTDSGSSVPRSHPNVPPQSQPIPSFPTGHPINYYPNSYNPSSLFFPGPSSLPLTSTQITPSSQAQRFYNQVSQGPPTVSFMNPSSVNSFSVNKTGAPLHGSAESSNSEHARDLHNVISSAPSASIQVTVKPAANLCGEKRAESSVPLSSPTVEKGSLKISRPPAEISSLHPQRDSENISESSLQHSKSTLMPVPSKPSVGLSDSADSLTTNSLSSAPPSLVEHPTSVASSTTEDTRREVFNRSDSNKDEQKKPGKKGHSLPQSQVGQQSTSGSTSLCGVIVETVETTKFPPLSGTVGPVHETTSEPLATIDAVAPAEPDSKTDSAVIVRTCESPKTVLTDSANISADISLENEIPNPENIGTKKRGEIMSPEESKEDNKIEITPKDISLKSSASVDQTEKNPILEVTITSSETGSLETTQQKPEEEPVFSCREGEGTGELATSTSAVMDSLITRTSSINLGHDDKSSASDTSRSIVDTLGGTDASITESGMVDQKSPVVSIPSHLEAISTCEIEDTGSNSTNLLCSSPGSKDKPLLETLRSKNTISKGKKKRKEALQKADRAGTTSDLYMAYKGPEEKKETVTPSESIESTSSIISKQISADTSQEDVPNESKAELDDWEDAAEMTPKLENSDDGKQVEGGLKHHSEDGNSMAKKYSRDFLLKFSEQCTDLPKGFEITLDIAEAFIFSTGNVPHESYPSPGRNIDRPMGGSRLDRRVSGMGDDDKWNKVPGPLAPGRDLRLDINYGGNVVGFRPGQGGNYGVLRNPRPQSPLQYAGGILSGPMQSMGPQGGVQRINSDSDRWQRATGFQRGLIPSPQTPLQVMHKAERKYEVGKITDEEQAKQRQLKGILNKLTPQNFEKLFEQVKQVNIDNAGTLTNVISQIFDKALTEPTFCEMYADFCYHLAGDLPDFNEDNERITFKRLLLNKCQEEFERGEREQEEANRAEEEDEAKQSEGEREEKRIQARRRMLGNIRLIGELYKKKMLTEKIMHSCIQKLLGQYQNPDEEDVEALCKLMSTIGEMIDHPKAKEHMDAYFDMMTKFSNNMKLSSRVRFMLKDSIDLRKNKWQQRRKVEGPKKIEEVHRDAANERQAQTNRLARGPSMGSSYRRVQQPMDFAPRGSNILSSPNAQMGGFRGLPQQPRGYGTQDVRTDERHPFENRTLSVPLPQRPLGDDSITLGPQGGLARGMSIRGQPLMSNIPFVDMHNPDPRRITTGLNGYNSERPAYASREEHVPRFVPDRFVSPAAHEQMNSLERNISYGSRDARNPDRIFDRSRPNTPPTRSREPTSMENVPLEKVLPEEHLRNMSMEAIKEFYSAKDENEVVLCVKDLNAPSFYPSMISIWITDSFERKDMERDLLAKLLINLTKPQDAMLSQDQLVKGFESVLAGLEDAVNDAPKAAEFLGGIFAKVILENVIPMTEIGRLIYEGGEEQGRLVEIGLAAEVLGSALEIIKTEKGDPILNEICTGSNLRLENFRPPNSKKSWRLDKFIRV